MQNRDDDEEKDVDDEDDICAGHIPMRIKFNDLHTNDYKITNSPPYNEHQHQQTENTTKKKCLDKELRTEWNPTFDYASRERERERQSCKVTR